MIRQQGKFILFHRTADFAPWLAARSVARRIRIIQNHHTWLPNYHSFAQNGNHFDHLRAMERSHVRERGFSEIAQNLTTFPDGALALCRPLDTSPAGIKGANASGICIEHVGNFDAGRDHMTVAHRDSIIRLNALLCARFGLAPSTDSIVYHHWYDLTTGARTNGTGNTKSCPGSAFFGGNSIAAAAANFLPLVLAEFRTAAGAPPGPPPPLYTAEVAADVLNVRNQPSLSGALVKQLRRGSDVSVYQEADGWARIDSVRSEWVFAAYLGGSAAPDAPAAPLYRAAVTATQLNVRPLPSTGDLPIRRLDRGTTIEVYEELGDWRRIHPAESEWVHGAYLSRVVGAGL
jgi:SH3-like domain-containing protein